MPTLIVGLAVVLVSAAGFAVAMFGRRPLPQPATAAAVAVAAPVTAARDLPNSTGRRRETRSQTSTHPGASPALSDAKVPHLRVDVPTPVRIRAAFLLTLGVLAAAALVGIVVSIVVVGLFTLVG